MTLTISVYFVGGTTLELDCDTFMVDGINRILAVHAGNENYAFPLQNMRHWKMTKKEVVQ